MIVIVILIENTNMGITGLLPFLEKSSKRTNINEFAGSTVAIDTYCWLHKGVFSCAEKLSMGQQTDAYVLYCMKFIHMLLSHKIKPILVFDGRHLPAKAETEVKRREARETNRRKAIELMRMGQHSEGRNLLRRAIDVTHEMALEVIKQCQQINVDCIVAPYEADAQLAYLNICGIADVVITEDSDLTLFGCKKVFFKMDINGNGLLVDQEKIHLAMDVNSEHFSMDDFRNMCILSGCDYLASLPGIGLSKARKFIKINTDCDIHRALTRLGSYLNMKSLVVTKEYRDAFILAIITFKHQLVFCPLKRQQLRLHPPTPDVTKEQLYYAGVETDPENALQLAYGNCDPFTFKVLHNFDPDKTENENTKCNTWGREAKAAQHVSIWAPEYKVKRNNFKESVKRNSLMAWANTANNEAVIHSRRTKKTILTKQQENIEDEQLNKREILDMYGSSDAMHTKNNAEVNVLTPGEEELSPVLMRRANPFTRQSANNKTSPSLLNTSKSRTKGRNIMRLKRTILNEGTITESKFFAKATTHTNDITTDDDKQCSDGNSLSQKENMEVENSVEARNANLKVLMQNGDAERDDSCSMDIDEEHNVSFISNECKDDGYSTTSSNCDLGKSHLGVSKNESLVNTSSMTESQNSQILLTSGHDVDNDDFLIQQGDIDVSNNSLFKWSAAKVPVQTNSKIKRSKSKSSSISRISVNSNVNTTNSSRRNQPMQTNQNQQSLLSMFGFEKKKLS